MVVVLGVGEMFGQELGVDGRPVRAKVVPEATKQVVPVSGSLGVDGRPVRVKVAPEATKSVAVTDIDGPRGVYEIMEVSAFDEQESFLIRTVGPDGEPLGTGKASVAAPHKQVVLPEGVDASGEVPKVLSQRERTSVKVVPVREGVDASGMPVKD